MISVEKTQDALMADVKANITGLKTVDVFEGEFGQKTLAEFILLTPFVIGSYRLLPIDDTQRQASGASGIKMHQFEFIVGAATLLHRTKAQRNCLSIIDSLIERYDGKPLTVEDDQVTFVLGSIKPIDGYIGLVVYSVALWVYD